MQPLPASLSQKDTSCKYCGVSYLIMHEIEKYKTEIGELKKQILILQRKNSQSASLERNNNSQVQLVAEMNAALNHELAGAKVELENQKLVSNQMEKQVIKYQIKLKDVTSTCFKIQDDLQQIKSQLFDLKQFQPFSGDVLQSEITRTFKILSLQNQTNSQQQIKIKSLQEEVFQLQAENAKLKMELDLEKKQTSELKIQNQFLTHQIEELNTRLQEHLLNEQKLVSEHEQVKDKLTNQLFQTESSLQNTKTEFKIQTTELQNLKADYQKLNENYNQLKEKQTKSEAQIQTLSAQLQQKINELEQYKLQNSSSSSQLIQQHKEQVSKLEQQIQDLQKQVYDLNQKYLMQSKQLDQRDSEIRSLNSTMQSLQLDVNNNKQQLTANQTQITQLNAQLNQLRAQLLDAEQSVSIFKSSNEQLKLMEKTYVDRVMRLEIELKSQTQQDKLTQLQSQIQNLQQQLTAQKDNNQQLCAQINAILAENASHKQQLDLNNKTIVDLDQKNQFLKEQIELMNKQLKNAPSEDTEKLKAEIKKLQLTVLHECKERNELMRVLNELRSRK
ncbi:Conserved_hypothetical protein [Hexamita inflata]|uniref:Uncharacterized protein n=1 Tax=Hexamita inflata TaxID=28002 RepID=A0AA86QAL0_9EUKA|nr:Conserved hypothetical protein [Hexamita inflata]